MPLRFPQDISDAQRWFDFFTGSSVTISAQFPMQHVEVFSCGTFSGNEKVLYKQFFILVKVALTFEIQTWKLIDGCGIWIVGLMTDMQLMYGDVMWITVWELLVVSYCKMIVNGFTVYLTLLILSCSEGLHLSWSLESRYEFEAAGPDVFNVAMFVIFHNHRRCKKWSAQWYFKRY